MIEHAYFLPVAWIRKLSALFLCCLMALELLDDVEVLTVMLTRASDILGPILGMIMQRRCKVDARVFGYAEEVVPRYQLNDFRRHFRVQRSTFAILVRLPVADPEIYFGWCQPRLRGYKGMHIYNTDYDRFK